MTKLLLTSAGFENPKIGNEFLSLINENPSKIKVLFIPTASRTKEELYYVEESRKELLAVGIGEENIIVFNLDTNISEKVLNEIDVLYVCGGNIFYLLHRVRAIGFDEVIIKLINDGKLYVGVSAGSILVGPNVNIPERANGNDSDSNDIGIDNFEGLNITNRIVVPHYSEERKDEIKLVEKSSSYPITTLTDRQALLILDKNSKVIE